MSELEPRPAAATESILVRWMGPDDINSAGSVHGGVVMKYCDEAAGLAAMRHCGQRVVTAGMDRMTFLTPIEKGELVTFKAKVNAAWRTSMEVGVKVETENLLTGEIRSTSSAYLTLVAVDEQGRPCPVPGLLAESQDELRREREAELRRVNRLAEREQIRASRES